MKLEIKKSESIQNEESKGNTECVGRKGQKKGPDFDIEGP